MIVQILRESGICESFLSLWCNSVACAPSPTILVSRSSDCPARTARYTSDDRTSGATMVATQVPTACVTPNFAVGIPQNARPVYAVRIVSVTSMLISTASGDILAVHGGYLLGVCLTRCCSARNPSVVPFHAFHPNSCQVLKAGAEILEQDCSIIKIFYFLFQTRLYCCNLSQIRHSTIVTGESDRFPLPVLQTRMNG